MLNEQFTWLTPFIQLECPSFAWRTKDAKTQSQKLWDEAPLEEIPPNLDRFLF